MENLPVEHGQAVFDLLGRHLLAYCVRYRNAATEMSRVMACTATVISVDGSWFVVTAGHIVSELIQAVDCGAIVVESARLVDCFGGRAQSLEPLPFDIASTRHDFIDSDGMDFGLIEVREFYRRALESNGITPFHEIDTAEDWSRDFIGFIVLGLPDEFIEQAEGEAATITTLVSATLVGLHPGGGIPATLRAQHRGEFVARLGDNFGREMKSMKGMSGGPIFGFSAVDGELRYYLVAIQASWLPTSRYIIGTPMRPIFARARELLTKG